MNIRTGIAFLASLVLAAACAPATAANPNDSSSSSAPSPLTVPDTAAAAAPTPTLVPDATASQAPTSSPVPDVAAAAALAPVSEATPAPKPAQSGSSAAIVRPTPRTIDRGSGSPAPDFEVTLMNGGALSLSDLRGKVVVLNFWASWCPPCRQEMPAFQRIWEEYEKQGVIFVGVAVSDLEDKALAFADQVGVTYPLAMDSTGDISRDYRAISLPTTFLIDRQGIEARRFVGAANEGVLRIFLKTLLLRDRF